MQAKNQHIEAAVRVRSKTREFEYVAARTTKRGTFYAGAAQVSGSRSKKYVAKCNAPTEATNLVAEYWKADVNAIKVDKAQRHAPEESAKCLAVIQHFF